MAPLVLLYSALFLAPVSPGVPTVTTQSLLREMGDRSAFCHLPKVPYHQLQASSYDRAETDPKDPKTWFANNDYGQFIRTEQKDGKTEWVVMEHKGPGAITRMWTPLLAEKDKMLIRIYLDGATKPTIEEPFNDLMRGKSLFKPPFAFISWQDPKTTSGVGSDLYYPIPFAKSCKVTMSEVPFYYSISYRAYPAGVKVKTFKTTDVVAAQPVADKVAASLTRSGVKIADRQKLRPVRLKAGGDVAIDLPKGQISLYGIALAFEKPLDLQPLRSVVISIKFDGEQTVWCPIGEFFGAGVHSKPVWDQYRYVSPYLFACFWPMPYQRSAQIRFHNYGKTPVSFGIQTVQHAEKWDASSLHFHATWRGQYPIATRPMFDWNYVEATGKGIYVGDTLTAFSPVGPWYGEGDERVYVNGEAFPSHLGTGTEDYYGYAWGMAQHYSSAFIAMPQRDLKGQDNWSGYTTTSRIRGLDAIPFDSKFKFDMEIWDWADTHIGYSATTFWYARPGATSNRKPIPLEAAKPLPVWSNTIKGALECEDMKVVSKTKDLQIENQSNALTEGRWSNDTQILVRGTHVGDKIELEVPVAQTGFYRVRLYATKSFDYGILKFMVGAGATGNFDLYNSKPIASGALDLGVHLLGKGKTTLIAEVVGSNPSSTGSHYYFGLDCVVLVPTKAQ